MTVMTTEPTYPLPSPGQVPGSAQITTVFPLWAKPDVGFYGSVTENAGYQDTGAGMGRRVSCSCIGFLLLHITTDSVTYSNTNLLPHTFQGSEVWVWDNWVL